MRGMDGGIRKSSLWTTAIAVASAIIGLAVVFNPLIALGLAVAAPAVVVVVRRPATVAVFLLLYGTVKYALQQVLPVGTGGLAAAEILLVVGVFVSALIGTVRNRSRSVPGFGPFLLMGAFLVLALMSWVLAQGTPLQLFAGVRALVTMPMLALCVAMAGTRRDFDLLWRYGVLLTIIQVPVAYLQFAFGGLATDVDLVNGTLGFGGANLLGVWMLAATAASLHLFVRQGAKRWLAGAVLFSSVIVMCGSRLGIVLLPVVVVAVGLLALRSHDLAVSGMRFAGSLLIVGAVSVAMIAGVYLGYSRAGIRIDDALSDLNPASLVERQTRIGDYSVPRLAYFTYGWTYLHNHSAFWPIGTGPASAGSGSAYSASGDYESTPFATGLRVQSQGLASYASQSRVVTQTSQLVSAVVEYGPLGALLLLGFYGAVGVRAIRVMWSEPSADPARRAVIPAAFAVFFVFATFGTVYGVAWEGLNIIGLGFWWCVLLSGSLATVPVADGDQS